MAGFVLSAVGGQLAGSVGAQIAGAVGTMIDGALASGAARPREGARLADLTVQTAAYGHAIPRVFGTVRVAGNLFWSKGIREVRRVVREQVSVGRSFGFFGSDRMIGRTQIVYDYYATFALGLCEGPIVGVRRIWADDQPIFDAGDGADAQAVAASNDNSALFRLYRGDEDQQPDPLIEASEGVGQAPAYRGLAYLVFEDLPLEPYGNRIPTITVEVVRGSPVGQSAAVESLRTLTVGDERVFPDSVEGVPVDFVESIGTIGNGGGQFNNGYVVGGAFAQYASYTDTAAMRRYIVRHRRAGDTELPAETLSYAMRFASDGRCCGWAKSDSFAQVYTAGGTTVHFVDFDGGDERLFTLSGSWSEGLRAFAKAGSHLYLLALESSITSALYYVDLAQAGEQATLSPLMTGLIADDLMFHAYDDALILFHQRVLSGHAHATAAASWQIDTTTSIPGGAGRFHGLDRLPSGAYAVLMQDEFFLVDPAGGVRDLGPVPGSATSVAGYAATGNGLLVLPHVPVTGRHSDYVMTLSLPGVSTPLADVVEDICAAAGLSAADIDHSALADTVDGYVVTGQVSARSALEPLMQAHFFDAVESDGKLRFTPRGQSAVAALSLDRAGAHPAGGDTPPALTRTRLQEVELPREIAVSYLDRDAGYEQGTQRSRRLETDSREQRHLELPMALSAGEAKRLADAWLDLAWAERVRHRFALSSEWAMLDAGDVVEVTDAGGKTTALRLLSVMFSGPGLVEAEAVPDLAAAHQRTTAADAPPGPSGVLRAVGRAELMILDLPILHDGEEGAGVYALAFGAMAGYRGATLEAKGIGDGGFYPIGFLPPATVGVAETVLPSGPTAYWDRDATVTVRLLGGGAAPAPALTAASEASVLSGANLALLGDELIQFATAEDLGGGVWRLGNLLRGRRGTEAAVDGHAAGDAFALLAPESLLRVRLPVQELGVERRFRAIAVGRPPSAALAEAAEAATTPSGASLSPFAPVHVAGERAGDGSLTITWVRRDRFAAWRDGADVVLSEDGEAYEVDILDAGGAVVRTIDGINQPSAVYGAAEQTADFGAPQTSLAVRIYQISTAVGRGQAAEAVL